MDWEIEIENIMAKNERDRLEAFLDLMNAYQDMPPGRGNAPDGGICYRLQDGTSLADEQG